MVLAADLATTEELVRLIHQVGPHIAALKTHVDMVEDFTMESWHEVVAAAHTHDLMLFEDRKFADIGKISQTQMGGVYDIRSWADIVTAHRVSGPDIIDGIAAGWDEVQRIGGVFLLAQMSSRGNLLSESYTDETVSTGDASPHVLGYIGNGSSPEEISSLREKVGEGKMVWTPGVNLSADKGVFGQRYGHPAEAVGAGADGIIVGSGIYGAADPIAAAAAYAEVSWSALLSR
ncbi:MAG: orotidine-5'-phosphate decarboxylase [Candidatus Thermoplasmatota archaeon]|nr:orotidine-5'-phosphate decarboxylase [Candidatus Thermoplasmatota archaeon]